MVKIVKAQPRLSPAEARILKTLAEYGYYLTTTQVSRYAGVSWNTAIRYLEKFASKGWVSQVSRGNRILWAARRPY